MRRGGPEAPGISRSLSSSPSHGPSSLYCNCTRNVLKPNKLKNISSFHKLFIDFCFFSFCNIFLFVHFKTVAAKKSILTKTLISGFIFFAFHMFSIINNL